MGLSSVSSSIKDMEDFDSQFDMIVNASSLGLKGEKNIIPSRLFDEQTTVYDIVYKPIKTDLINKAKEKNCRMALCKCPAPERIGTCALQFS